MTKFFDDSKKWLIEAIQLKKKDKMKDKNKNLQEELESIGMINNVDKLNIEDGIRGSAQMALSTALKDSQRHRKAAKEMHDKQEAEARKALSREISNKEHPEPLDYLKPNSQIELKESLFESIDDTEDKVFKVTYKESPEIFSSVMIKASNENEAKEKLSAKKPGKVIVGVEVMSDDAVKDMKSRGMSLMEDTTSKKEVEPLEESAEPITEDIEDSWDEELIYDIDGSDVLGDIEGLIYEIRNTYRGYQSGAHTYEELSEYISDLASSLSYFAEGVSRLAESEDNEVKLNESVGVIGADVGDKIRDTKSGKTGTVIKLGQSGNEDLVYVDFGKGLRKINAMRDAQVDGRYEIISESKDNEVEDTTSEEMSPMEDGCVQENPAAVEGQPSTECVLNGIASELSALIKDEWEAIEGYKSTIINLQSIGGYDEIVSVLEEIAGEEYVHVGQLQRLSEIVAPQANKIADGEEEAEKQLAGEDGHSEEVVK